MKTKKKIRSGSVKVKPDILDKAKEICDEMGFKLSAYVTQAVSEKNLQIVEKTRK